MKLNCVNLERNKYRSTPHGCEESEKEHSSRIRECIETLKIAFMRLCGSEIALRSLIAKKMIYGFSIR